MHVACPHCRAEVLLLPEHHGILVACPNCGGAFQSPIVEALPVSQAAPAPVLISTAGKRQRRMLKKRGMGCFAWGALILVGLVVLTCVAPCVFGSIAHHLKDEQRKEAAQEAGSPPAKTSPTR